MHQRRLPIIALLLLSSLVAAEYAFAHAPARVSIAPDRPVQSLPLPLGDRDLFFFESFEDNWPPDGWVILEEGAADTWARDDLFPRSGVHSAWVDYAGIGVQQDGYLVSKAIDLSNHTSAYLSFYEAQRFWPGYGEHHYVGVSTTSQTDPNAFVWLADWTPANHTLPPQAEDGAPVYAEDPSVIDLNAYVGEPVVYVCLRYFGTFADEWFIDDLKVFETLAHDVAVDAISPDALHVEAPNSVVPEVIVENIGANSEIFDLRVTVSESGLIVYDQILSVSLGVAGADTVSFPPLALSPGHYYHLAAAALLPTDEEPANDTSVSHLDTYTEAHVPLGYLHTNAT